MVWPIMERRVVRPGGGGKSVKAGEVGGVGGVGGSWSQRSASACELSCGQAATPPAHARSRAPDRHGSSRSCKATSTTTRYQETSQVWRYFEIGCLRSGDELFADEARNA